jgi:lipoyl(octanoyl) transferase
LASRGRLLNLGLTMYEDACAVQLRLHEFRAADQIDDVLIVTEHFPVYTLGRTTRPEHVGREWERTTINGIPCCVTDRGGSVTYHGPGQVVGYPILALRQYCAGPKAYIGLLEDVLIRGLTTLAIPATRRPGLPGVWVKDRKIASLGVRISRGVTRHGFALNVTNNLAPFSDVTACGLVGSPVTSIALESPGEVTVETARAAVVQAFEEVFEISLLAEIGPTPLTMAVSH